MAAAGGADTQELHHQARQSGWHAVAVGWPGLGARRRLQASWRLAPPHCPPAQLQPSASAGARHGNPKTGLCGPRTRRRRAWRTNLLLIAQAVLFIVLIWAVDKAGKPSPCTAVPVLHGAVPGSAAPPQRAARCRGRGQPPPCAMLLPHELSPRPRLPCPFASPPACSVCLPSEPPRLQPGGGGNGGGGGACARLLRQPLHAGGPALLHLPVCPHGAPPL